HRLDTVKIIKYVHAESGLDCILQCVLQEILCRSANFRNTLTSEADENCELLKTVDSEEPAGSLKKDENFDYYKLLQPEKKPEDAVSSSASPQIAEEISTANSATPKVTDGPTTQPTSVVPCKSGEVAFGMDNGRIQDSQITASTVHNPGLSPQQGRLNSASSWSAGLYDQNQWIQVDLGREEVVTAIATQGRANYPQWVKTYSVCYGSNGNAFEPYKIDDAVKVRKNNYNC
ncbi:Hypothetical predicted protein, partial [Paramuricea clavata]